MTRVGFPTLDAGHVYRVGEWTPIMVDVDLLDQPLFDGAIRASQYDMDGDQVYDSVDVHLNAQTRESARRFLYVLPNPMRGDGRFVVEFANARGESVEVVSQGVLTYRPSGAQQPVAISDADILILSVSTGAVGRIAELVEAQKGAAYNPPVHVGHVSPSELPELALGLSAVDYVVWDDARSDDLTERQRRALIDWVKSGGTLLMAAARTAGSIAGSSLAKHLPVDLGETRSVENLPNVRRLLIAPPEEDQSDRLRRRRTETDEVAWYDQPYPEPVVIVRTTARPSARVLARASLRVSDASGADGIDEVPVVAERWLDEGRLIFCAVTLKDLLSGPDDASEFFEKIFYLNRQTDENGATPQPVSLFGSVVGAVAFSTSSSVYLFCAFLFSVVYLLVSTGGTWWFLGRRRRRQHAWSAFALVAMGAGLVSVVSVGWVRGLGDRVHQLTVVDVDAGSRFGRAVVFWGVKTATDRELDLWLPSDPTAALEPSLGTCRLRPLPPSNDPTDAQLSFADPEDYQVVPGSGVVEGVRVRSTLKRFEGRWDGPLAGRLDGRVVMNRDGTLSAESFVDNELGVELQDCYLLHAQLDPFDVKRGSLAPSPRDSAIYAYPIRRIPSGTRTELAPLCNPTPDPTGNGARGAPPRLQERHKGWSAPLVPSLRLGFGSDRADFTLGQERNALLIASTVGDFDPASLRGRGFFGLGRATFSRDRLRSLDLRARLRRDTAILVGFADGPGPVRLFQKTGERTYRPMEPDRAHSTTMYRVRIPVVWPDRVEVDETDEADPTS